MDGDICAVVLSPLGRHQYTLPGGRGAALQPAGLNILKGSYFGYKRFTFELVVSLLKFYKQVCINSQNSELGNRK
jgi:hypothetical protein